MEWSDYKVHKYILKAYGVNGQIAKTLEEMDALKQLLRDSTGPAPDKSSIVNAIASVEVLLEEMKYHFDINTEVDVAKSDILTDMAVSIGLVDADEVKVTASKASHKLKPEDVIAIREAYANNEASQIEIARIYNVTPSIISDVVTGVTYKNLSGPISARKMIGKLTDEQVAEIREKYAAGNITQAKLAEEYGVTLLIISLITSGKIHRDAPGPITIKGKGHSKITIEQIGLDKIEQIREDYNSGNYSLQTLSEKYGIPAHLIRKAFREGRAKVTQPVKLTKIDRINAQIVNKYVHVKGVMPGEVETYLMHRFDPKASLDENLLRIKDFAKGREWNAKTIQACKFILKKAYESSE